MEHIDTGEKFTLTIQSKLFDFLFYVAFCFRIYSGGINTFWGIKILSTFAFPLAFYSLSVTYFEKERNLFALQWQWCSFVEYIISNDSNDNWTKMYIFEELRNEEGTHNKKKVWVLVVDAKDKLVKRELRILYNIPFI